MQVSDVITKGTATVVRLFIFRLAVPELVIVTVFSGDGTVPRMTSPKSSGFGEAPIFGTGTAEPVPLTLTVTEGAVGSFEGILKVSVSVTTAIGE